jgi:hypothetical protein
MSDTPLSRARAYLRDHARPLERALVAHRLDGAPAEDVLEALATFQNDDGGFGGALEPDLRSPSSAPFTTSVAFQVLRELEVPGDHPIAGRALRYLHETFDPGTASWPVTPGDVAEHPHAPWWRPEAATPSAENLNPRAELLGVYLEHREHVDGGQLSAVEAAVRELLATDEPIEFHALLCVRRLAESPGIDPAWRAELVPKLVAAAEPSLGRDRAAWAEYGLRPTDLAPSPGGLLSEAFGEVAAAYCGYLLETQEPDGSWAPAWSWAADYPKAWAMAEQEWRGVLVERNLSALAAYEGVAEEGSHP